MSMVERLEFTCPDCDPDTVPVNHGRYVRYSDFASLQAEVERLKTKHHRLYEALESIEARAESHKDWAEECASRRVKAEAIWAQVALENSDLTTRLEATNAELAKLREGAEPVAWRVGAWGDGSTNPGRAVIFCDAHETAIAADISAEMAAVIVEAHNLSVTHPATEQTDARSGDEALRIAEERLSSLLARVHRDGGHYEAEHGTEKAWADADEIVARIYADTTHPAHAPSALSPAAPEGRETAAFWAVQSKSGMHVGLWRQEYDARKVVELPEYAGATVVPLYSRPTAEADPLDQVELLFLSARVEADKAMRKFPQPNYVVSKVAEEAGEVVKAAIHCAEGRETPESVIAEIRQAMAMLIRLYVEGDQVHGLPPLAQGGQVNG